MTETKYIERNAAGDVTGIYANPQFAADGKTLRTERVAYKRDDPVIANAEAEWKRRQSEALAKDIQTGRSR